MTIIRYEERKVKYKGSHRWEWQAKYNSLRNKNGKSRNCQIVAWEKDA